MDCCIDHGPVPASLEALIAAVREIPAAAWVHRVDPESDKTTVVREGSPALPAALVTAAIGAAVEAYLPAGYQNRIVLSRVPAGEGILPHRDDFGEAIRSASFHCHIPLITAEAAVLGFPQQNRVEHLLAGHLYSIDETEEHYVANPSAVDRIHLLFAHFPHNGLGRPAFLSARQTEATP